MTERWQSEVRKLRDVEPTPGIWEDAMRRPPYEDSDDERPPTGKRVIAGVLALVVFIVAGAFAWQAFRPNDQQTSAEPGVSDVLRLRCDPQSIEVLTPVVAAQPDGLHVVADVTGSTHPWVGLRSETYREDGTHYSGSDGVDGEFVRQVHPGDGIVWCGSELTYPDGGDGPGDHPFASFSIVDPNGVFTDYRLDCTDWTSVSGNPSIALKFLPALSPEGAFNSRVEGVMPDDVVERAGYPVEAPPGPVYRLTRDGRVIGWFIPTTFQDSYYIDEGAVCNGYGLSLRPAEEPSPGQVQSGLSDVLRVRCDAQSIEVLTPVVAAQPDGVHVIADVTNGTDLWVGLKWERPETGTAVLTGGGVDGEFVSQVPPGEAIVWCETGLRSGNGPVEPTGSFSVVDPNGVFTD